MPRRKSVESIQDVVIGIPRARAGSRMFTLGLVITGIAVAGATVMIGRSDSGPINVATVIQESNDVRAGEGGEHVNTVSQSFQNMPNGGLVPQENQPVETQAQGDTQTTDTASTTASTTEETVIEGDLANEQTESAEETPEAPAE